MEKLDDQKRYDFVIKSIVTIGDVVLCNLLLYAAYALGGLQGESTLLQTHLLISACSLAGTATAGIVVHRRRTRSYQVLGRVLRSSFVITLLATPALILGSFAMPTWFAYVLWVLSLVPVITLFRLAVRRAVRLYWHCVQGRRGVVIVGSGKSAEQLYHELVGDNVMGYRVCGYFDVSPSSRMPVACPYLGKPTDVIAWLDQNSGDVRNLYYCLSSQQLAQVMSVIEYCENHLVRFYSVPGVEWQLHWRMHLYMQGSVPCLSLHREPLSWVENRMLKRTFDIVFSLLFLLTLFVPTLIVVSIVTSITMPGPIFFRQRRNGINGKEFYCLKFRSMKVNEQADTLQATRNDPRKTRWGDFMRRTSIDELPQFINVLLGQMSVVGPRPHMVKHTEEYSQLIDKYMVRHYIKPGITGWSQVSGLRGETKDLSQMENRIRGDIWYLEHWSFGLDLYIVYKTVVNAIRGEDNAY